MQVVLGATHKINRVKMVLCYVCLIVYRHGLPPTENIYSYRTCIDNGMCLYSHKCILLSCHEAG